MALHQELFEKVRSYRTPEVAVQLLNSNPPMIIAGATATGKSSVLKRIEEISEYRHVITHTTRPPRPGEVDGQNYWFVDEEGMIRLLDDQAMIEVKAVHGDTLYGPAVTSYQAVISSGHKPILVIDVQGVEELSKSIPKQKAFFILPPNFDEWMQRLEKRGQMSSVEKASRLNSARLELEEALRQPRFILVTNYDIHRAAHEILGGTTDPRIQAQNRELAQTLISHIQSY
ncbi:hypothetical protein KW789_01915 [Candidatus Saccharibacteria bacterium]|jgi:guanylate kinase|nr:hypothetical protein [Candidatus Saccharibacteria bacterium]